jgi:hypothetical protein
MVPLMVRVLPLRQMTPVASLKGMVLSQELPYNSEIE